MPFGSNLITCVVFQVRCMECNERKRDGEPVIRLDESVGLTGLALKKNYIMFYILIFIHMHFVEIGMSVLCLVVQIRMMYQKEFDSYITTFAGC